MQNDDMNVFQVDLKDQAYTRWKYQEIQSKVRGFSQKEGVDYGKKFLQGLDTCIRQWILHQTIGVIEVEEHVEKPPRFGTLCKELPMRRRICTRSEGTHGIAHTVT